MRVGRILMAYLEMATMAIDDARRAVCDQGKALILLMHRVVAVLGVAKYRFPRQTAKAD